MTKNINKNRKAFLNSNSTYWLYLVKQSIMKNVTKKMPNKEIFKGILKYLGELDIIILIILVKTNISIGCNFKPGIGSKVLYPKMKAKITQCNDFSIPLLVSRMDRIPTRVKIITNKSIIMVYSFLHLTWNSKTNYIAR